MRVEIKIIEDNGDSTSAGGKHFYGVLAHTRNYEGGVVCTTEFVNTLEKEGDKFNRFAIKLSSLQRVLNDLLSGQCPREFLELAKPLLDHLNKHIKVTDDHEEDCHEC